MCDRLLRRNNNTSLTEETTTSTNQIDTIATILTGENDRKGDDKRSSMMSTTTSLSWRIGVTETKRMEAEDVLQQRPMVQNDANHHADDTTSTGESSTGGSSSSSMEEEDQTDQQQRNNDNHDDNDDDGDEQGSFDVNMTHSNNETNSSTTTDDQQASQLDTNVQQQQQTKTSSTSTRTLTFNVFIGPFLMISSMVMFATPLIWGFVLSLSTYTWLCLGMFGFGITHMCVTMGSIFNDQFHSYQIQIVNFLDHVVLDNVLEQVIQGAAVSIISISSLITLYLLPISRECRGELIDSSVGPVFCRQHGWNSDCTCANKLFISDILTKQGGLMKLFRTSLNHLSSIRMTTSTSTPLLISTSNETDHGDDNDVAFSSGSTSNSSDDMVWNDYEYHHGHTPPALIGDAAKVTTIITTRRNGTAPTLTPTFDAALRRVMRECCQAMVYPIYVDVSTELKRQRVRLFIGTIAVIGVRQYSKRYTCINHIFLRRILHPLLQRTKLLLLRNRTKHNPQQTAAASATTVVLLAAAAAAAAAATFMRRHYYSKVLQRTDGDHRRTTSSSSTRQQQPLLLPDEGEEDGPLSSHSTIPSTNNVVVVQRRRSSSSGVEAPTHYTTKAGAITTSSFTTVTALSSLLPTRPRSIFCSLPWWTDKLKPMLVRWSSNRSYKHVVLLCLAFAVAARRKKQLILLSKKGRPV